jgi:hypothetical protein
MNAQKSYKQHGSSISEQTTSPTPKSYSSARSGILSEHHPHGLDMHRHPHRSFPPASQKSWSSWKNSVKLMMVA